MTETATQGTWTLDPEASAISLHHKTVWGLMTVRGTFSQVQGQGEVDADGTAHGRIEIAAATLDTKHGKRDKHLRSADFFHVDQHPMIVVEVAAARPRADGRVDVEGTVTARGVTRPLRTTATATAVEADRATLTAEVVMDRAEFEMGWNKIGMIVGPATVAVNATFTRTPG